MDNKKNRELIGIICIILGGLFIIAGLVFFVVNNRNNIYGKKVSATVMSSVVVQTSDNKKTTLLNVMYAVGNENVNTTYNYPGELKEGEVFLELYYDARNPKRVIEAGWTFEGLFLSLLGAVIFLLGLYYKGVTDFGIVEMKKPDESAPERVKKTYETRQRIGNGLFPSIGGLVFIAFGVVMVVTKHNNWMWIFVGAGILIIFYFSLDMVPAIFELRQLKLAKKFKGQVVDTDNLGIDSVKEDAKADGKVKEKAKSKVKEKDEKKTEEESKAKEEFEEKEKTGKKEKSEEEE